MTSDGRLLISKIELFKTFGETLKTLENNSREQLDLNLNYRETKLKFSKNYLTSWNLIKDKYFKIWTVKPENLMEFKIQ